MKKQLIFGAMLAIGFLVTSFVIVDKTNEEAESDGLKWYTDLEEVHKLSKENNKPIFGFFTGSDWCGWCHKLQSDVFAKQAFIDWAKESVILLELDFPKRKVLDPALKKQNAELQQAFGVRGYPTVWIFNSDKDKETGKMNLNALGKLGYMPSEVDFIKQADAILAKGKEN